MENTKLERLHNNLISKVQHTDPSDKAERCTYRRALAMLELVMEDDNPETEEILSIDVEKRFWDLIRRGI